LQSNRFATLSFYTHRSAHKPLDNQQ